jgi:F-type H+-transporting ATPase subunit delta
MAKGEQRVAKRYARAVFESVGVSEQGVLLDVLDQVANAWSNSSEMRSLIGDPTISRSEKSLLVREIAAIGRAGLSGPVAALLDLLVENRRILLVGGIRDEVLALIRERQRTVFLRVTTSREQSIAEREAIVSDLQSKMGGDVQVEWGVDSSLIGGMVVRSGDKLLNRSFSGVLQQIRSHIGAA